VGRYKDEVLCNVISMHATNLLLGKPWQFDKKKSSMMNLKTGILWKRMEEPTHLHH
jgi:hypothetical protein